MNPVKTKLAQYKQNWSDDVKGWKILDTQNNFLSADSLEGEDLDTIK